jgi:flagellar biosynthesis protein FliQ
MPVYLMLLQSALTTDLEAVLPIIVLLLLVGITTATIQAACQLEDIALNLLPKTVVMILGALFGGFGAVPLFKTLIMAWISHAGSIVHRTWS